MYLTIIAEENIIKFWQTKTNARQSHVVYEYGGSLDLPLTVGFEFDIFDLRLDLGTIMFQINARHISRIEIGSKI